MANNEAKKTPNEKKAKTNKNTSSGKKTGTKTAPAARSTGKKSGKAEKKTKTNQMPASAGWREKKSQIRERNKGPKTLAEKKALTEQGPIRRFLTRYNGLIDMILVLFFAFSLLCLYSIASKNERDAAVWCANMSKTVFGEIGFLFYIWVVIFCVRYWARNIHRFKVMHYKRYLYFLGLYFYAALILQYNAKKTFTPSDQAAGVIAESVVNMITNVLGNSGMLILLIFLLIFFLWQAWRFFAAIEKEQNSENKEVPVKVYWDFHTAAEAEAMEAEKQQQTETLTSDIEEDFRTTMGLLTAAEPEKKERPKIHLDAGKSFRKLRETLQEIAQPIPDKEAMIPAEKPQPVPDAAVKPVTSRNMKAEAEMKKADEKAAEKPKKSGKKSGRSAASQLTLPQTPEKIREEETLPPEPVFENEEDHNGSGLLSAPAAPVTVINTPKEEKPEVRPAVQVRSRKVRIDEESEKVETTRQDYSFVPTIPQEDEQTGPQKAEVTDPWILPDKDKILDPIKPHKGTSPEDLKSQVEAIEKTLELKNVPASVVEVQCGPTFSQFGIEPGFIVHQNGRKTRVRISRIEAVKGDLLLCLSTKQLTIEAPIPGKTYVGIQIQNKTRVPVSLREVIESEEYRSHKYELGIALGKDINGSSYGADLTRMPHLLIAGATGSGKSVCLNAILSCLLLHNTPDQLKLVLIDPKHVELSGYNGIPHLITPVITEVEQVANVLQWVLREMDMRNLHFMENGVRNIQEYNRKFPGKKLPYIVIVIDELASLMMEVGSEIENSIVRLAQTARAMGIHLIVATQRPSRTVITGTIKGNLPTRIAFAVATSVDSRVILDRSGAEQLFGKGDMYFLSIEETALKRLQCVYVSDEEINRIVSYWQKKPRIDGDPANLDPDLVHVPQPVTEKVIRPPELSSQGTLTQLPLFNEPAPQLKKDKDVLFDEAVKLIQREGRVSANMLVSRLSIGYSRANKLLTMMEEAGIISKQNPNPAIPREILDYGKYGPKNDGEKD